MSTIFQTSCAELLEICNSLNIHIDSGKTDDIDHLRSKVTEYLLLNNLTTLHRFQLEPQNSKDATWTIPEDCQSCKQFKNRHKYTPPDPDSLLTDEELMEKLEKKSKKNRRKWRYYPNTFACIRACSRIFINCITCCRK